MYVIRKKGFYVDLCKKPHIEYEPIVFILKQMLRMYWKSVV